MKNIFLTTVLLLTCIMSFAQVGIGTETPDASAALEVQSSTQGFLPPRMTKAQIAAITNPAEGLMAYCTDCTQKSLYFNNGTEFVSVVDGTSINPKVGDFYQGGIVVWVNPADTAHGLICSKFNLGALNFNDAVAACNSLVEEGFDDWVFPNIVALRNIYSNKADVNTALTGIGGDMLLDVRYRSSTNVGGGGYYISLNFANGAETNVFVGDLIQTRAIRAY